MKKRTSKIYATLLALAVAVLVSLGPRSAKACGSGGGSGALAAVGIFAAGLVVTDVVFTGYDLVQGVQEERASKGMAIAEIAVAAPQFAVGGLILSDMPRTKAAIPVACYVAWMGTLVGHGIGTLATMPPQPPGPPEPATPPKAKPPSEPEDWTHPRLSVAPTMLNDGMRSAMIPGVSAVGRF
jgi:hypothetical protein